jgi:nitroreductase
MHPQCDRGEPQMRCPDRSVDRSWTPEEVTILANAVNRAPSVHNTQPWGLEVRGRSAAVYERPDLAVERHDWTGRDRLISCGTAVTNIELAIRHCGWSTERRLIPEPGTPELLARVWGGWPSAPSAAEEASFDAIERRASYRREFAARRVPSARLEAVLRAAVVDGAQARQVVADEDRFALAELLDYAARVHQDDIAYQRELAVWTVPETAGPQPGQGIPEGALGRTGLSAAGLVTPSAAVPDRDALAVRIANEAVLVVTTPGDGRRDHIIAGAAMQRAWLAAISQGLVASVITQPLQLSEVRTSLAERLVPAGFPQILLRVGYAVPSAAQGARRRVSRVFQARDTG